MTPGWNRLLPAVGFAAAVLAAPAAAHADDTVRACVSKDGRVRVLSGPALADGRGRRHASRCHRNEQLITWNITGPEGPAGPTGPPGPPGPGLSGVQFYTVGNGDLKANGTGLFATSFGPPPGGTFATGATQLMAGIHLPQGARILALSAHVYDNSPSNLTFELLEQNLADGTTLQLASAASSGAAGAPYTLEAPLAGIRDVDNERFHYFVRVMPAPTWTASTLQVVGLTVKYTLEPLAGT